MLVATDVATFKQTMCTDKTNFILKWCSKDNKLTCFTRTKHFMCATRAGRYTLSISEVISKPITAACGEVRQHSVYRDRLVVTDYIILYIIMLHVCISNFVLMLDTVYLKICNNMG